MPECRHILKCNRPYASQSTLMLLGRCSLWLQQIVGAICGSLLVNALTPYDTIYVGMGDGGPGCFDQQSINHSISKSQLFGWEVSPLCIRS